MESADPSGLQKLTKITYLIRTGMSSFSLGLNQLIAFGNRGSNQPLCCSQGQRLKGGKTCPPLWLWSSRITVSLILLCSVALLPASLQLEVTLQLDGSYWFLFWRSGLWIQQEKAPSSWTRCRTGPASRRSQGPQVPRGFCHPSSGQHQRPQEAQRIVTHRLFSRSTSGAQTVVSSSILIVYLNNQAWCPCFLLVLILLLSICSQLPRGDLSDTKIPLQRNSIRKHTEDM